MEEPERFRTAAPLLCGKDFEKVAKEHIDSVKSMKKLSGSGSSGPGKQQFFRQGRPHISLSLPGGTAPTEEAADSWQEAISAPTRQTRRTTHKTAEARNGGRTASPRRTPEIVFPGLPLCCTKFIPYLATRSAHLAKQGHKEHSRYPGDTGPPPGRTLSTLPVELAEDHSQRVGVERGERLQDRIPAEALPTEEASSHHLHTVHKKRCGLLIETRSQP